MFKLLKEVRKLNKMLEGKNAFKFILENKYKLILKLYNKCRKEEKEKFNGNYTDVSLKLEGQKELLEEILKNMEDK